MLLTDQVPRARVGMCGSLRLVLLTLIALAQHFPIPCPAQQTSKQTALVVRNLLQTQWVSEEHTLHIRQEYTDGSWVQV